jgi:tRNA dimethylallyltransferase
MEPAVAIFGPTATGKSAVALALAERLGGEILSCDAMQAYRGLPILTNQPSAAESERVPHHLVGIWELEHAGSVAEFAVVAHATVDEVLRRGQRPVFAGGSGLYLRAAIADLEPRPEPAPGERERFEQLYDSDPAAAHRALLERDPAVAAAVHPNDRRRVVRGLELHAAGTTLRSDSASLWETGPRIPTLMVGLDLPRSLGDERIVRRTAEMFERGVVEEVRSARDAHVFSHTAERIHGLQDVTATLDGEIDVEEAIRRLVLRTRQYAKRQRTWMRRVNNIHVLDAARPADDIAAEIEALL